MGIIKTQGIRNSIVNYVGVAVGAVSTLFVYPLDGEAHGLAMFLMSMAVFLFPFASGGITAAIVRFFPEFETADRQHHGFFAFLLVSAMGTFGFFCVVALLFYGPLLAGLDLMGFQISVFKQYGLETFLLCFLVLLYSLFFYYATALRHTVVPGVFYNLIPKLALPVLVLLSAKGLLSLDQFVQGVLWFHLLMVVCLAGYLMYIGEWNWRWPARSAFTGARLRAFGVYALYGMLGGLGSVLAFRMDSIMIPALMDLDANSIYNINMFIANTIEIPTRSLVQIAMPVIAASWAARDMDNIRDVYRKSSLNLLMAGIPVFVCIWVALPDLMSLTARPDALLAAKYVVFWIGMSKLFDMATSINNQIIAYSPYFRFNLYITLVLGVLNFVLNLYLIPRYGVTGAAVATFISLGIFNVGKLLFIRIRFGMHPFSIGMLWLVLFGMVSALAGYGVGALGWPALLSIPAKCVAVFLVFVPAALYFNISPDVNALAQSVWERVRRLW